MLVLGAEEAGEEGAVGELVLVGMRQLVVDDRGDLLEMEIAQQLLDLVGHDGGSSSSSGRTKYVVGHEAQREAFEAIEIKEAVLLGERDGLEERRRADTRARGASSRRSASVPRPALRALSAAAYAGTGGSARASACSSGDGCGAGPRAARRPVLGHGHAGEGPADDRRDATRRGGGPGRSRADLSFRGPRAGARSADRAPSSGGRAH